MHSDGGARSSHQLSQPVASTSQVSASISKTLSTYRTTLEGPSETRSSSSSTSSSPNSPSPKLNGTNAALIPSLHPGISRKAATLPGLLASTSLPAKPHTNAQLAYTNFSSVRSSKPVPVATDNNISSSRASSPVRPALHRLQQGGGSKTVQFSTVPQSQMEPVHPSEVLARRPSSAPNTSAGAAVSQFPAHEINDQGEALNYGDVVRQGKSSFQAPSRIFPAACHITY